VALVFVLALLLDSACTTACIPVELEAPAEHCASEPESDEHSDRGCDLHAHLKPVVKDRSDAAALTIEDAPAQLELPATARDPESVHRAVVEGVILHVPSLPRRSSVLRI
jgi:hypothetical protein